MQTFQFKNEYALEQDTQIELREWRSFDYAEFGEGSTITPAIAQHEFTALPFSLQEAQYVEDVPIVARCSAKGVGKQVPISIDVNLSIELPAWLQETPEGAYVSFNFEMAWRADAASWWADLGTTLVSVEGMFRAYRIIHSQVRGGGANRRMNFWVVGSWLYSQARRLIEIKTRLEWTALPRASGLGVDCEFRVFSHSARLGWEYARNVALCPEAPHEDGGPLDWEVLYPVE